MVSNQARHQTLHPASNPLAPHSSGESSFGLQRKAFTRGKIACQHSWNRNYTFRGKWKAWRKDNHFTSPTEKPTDPSNFVFQLASWTDRFFIDPSCIPGIASQRTVSSSAYARDEFTSKNMAWSWPRTRQLPTNSLIDESSSWSSVPNAAYLGSPPPPHCTRLFQEY